MRSACMWLAVLFAVVVLVMPLLMLTGCSVAQPGSAPRTAEDWKGDAVALATAVGDVVVQTRGTAWVLREAPDLLPLLDANQNGVIELAEVVGAPPALFDRAAVARLIVAATAEYLRRN